MAWDIFENWDAKDTANTISGVGAFASASGKYEKDKQKNKILADQLNYEKSKDALAEAKSTQAQSNYDDAFNYVPTVVDQKKKKKDDPLNTSVATV